MNGRKKEEREERKEGREGGKEIERKRNQEDREQLTEGMDRMRGTWDTVVREVVFAQNLDDEEPAIKPTPYLFPQVLSPCCVCGCVEGCTYSQRCDVELSWLMRNVCSKSWTSYRHSNCSTQFLNSKLAEVSSCSWSILQIQGRSRAAEVMCSYVSWQGKLLGRSLLLRQWLE